MNSIEKIHPTQVQGLTPTKELGRDIVALRYDLALPVIEGMIAESLRQEQGDKGRGRLKLSAELGKLASSLSVTKEHLEKIISICAPYIEEEKKRNQVVL